jgi:hypothetical protein
LLSGPYAIKTQTTPTKLVMALQSHPMTKRKHTSGHPYSQRAPHTHASETVTATHLIQRASHTHVVEAHHHRQNIIMADIRTILAGRCNRPAHGYHLPTPRSHVRGY